jgi:hypothetical protein
MKNTIGIIIFLFFALFVYTKLAGPIPFYINSVTTNQTNLFSADGEGKATAVPDQATVDAGVTQQGTTVADTQNKVNTQTQKIITEIKKLGISDQDIKTTNYSLNPNYGQNGGIQPMIYPPINNGGNQTIIGYSVTQNLEINVKDLTKVNKVIDTATANGANLVGGANFNFSDQLQKKLENQARVQAVNNAKQKAESLASAAGVHLGRVINVVEGQSGFPQPLAMKSAAAGTVDQSIPTNVTPGENSVTIDVTIYYETY